MLDFKEYAQKKLNEVNRRSVVGARGGRNEIMPGKQFGYTAHLEDAATNGGIEAVVKTFIEISDQELNRLKVVYSAVKKRADMLLSHSNSYVKGNAFDQLPAHLKEPLAPYKDPDFSSQGWNQPDADLDAAAAAWNTRNNASGVQ